MSRMMSNTLIPSGWSLPTLAAVADVSSGIGFPNEFQGNATGDLPFYKVSDVSFAVLKTCGILGRANHYVSYEMAERLKGRPLRVGSTVFAKIGEAVHLNRRALVSTPCLIDNNVMAVKARFDSMDRYLHYFLKTVELGEYARSTTVPSLRKGDVESLLLPLAPEAEQTRIANQLDTLLARVQACNDRFDAIPALLKRFRQTVLVTAHAGGLTADWRVDHGHELVEVTTLGSVLKVSSGNFLPAKDMAPNGKIPVFGGNGINGYHDHGNVQEKTLVIGRVGFYCGSIHLTPNSAWVTDNALIVRHHPSQTNREYLHYALKAVDLRVNDSSTAQPVISGQKIYPLALRVPSMAEQLEIVRRIDALFALADRIEARCIASRTQAQRLTPLVLAKAFRGELVPQEPNDEPASALLERIASANTAVAGKNKRKVPVALKKPAQAAINL